jgi:hypothetical protein
VNEGRFRNDALLIGTEWLADRLGDPDRPARHADGRAVPGTRRHHAPAHAGVRAQALRGIFLADRLIILTNRPTRVKKIMEIDLPRPRSYQALASPRYLALKEEALDALHEEALQAFAAGSTGAYDLVDAYRRRAGSG